MLSLTNISAGQADGYYLKDNYYLKTEAQWHGKGAQSLGLTGQVRRAEFHALINGRAPDGTAMVTAPNGRHRAGLDLTFSAPKSVSILAEVAGDTRVREAHEEAVRTALNYAEINFSQARVTRDGVTLRVDTGNLIIAAFGHSISREPDPQIHTHAVVMNMTLRPDGKWRALSNERLYANKMLLGQIYRNELGARLKELGYAIEITNEPKGLFEVRGLDRDLIEHFSRRSAQIDAKVAALMASGRYPNAGEHRLREVATLDSRAAKRDVEMKTLVESWHERLGERGLSVERIKEKALSEAHREAGREVPHMDGLDAAIHELEMKAAVWSRQEMLREALKREAGSLRVSDAEKRIEGLLKGRRLVLLAGDRFTTREAMRTELANSDREKHGDKGRSITEPPHLELEREVGFSREEDRENTRGERELER